LAEPDRLALAVEASREPRPELPALLADAEMTDGTRTQELRSYQDAPVETHGSLKGWRTVALIERLAVPSRDLSEERRHFVQRCWALEVRTGLSERGSENIPFGSMTLGDCYNREVSVRAAAIPAGNSPVFGVVDEKRRGGLGVPIEILGPLPWSRHLLDLSLVDDRAFLMSDKIGPGLTLRTWRTLYTDGQYELARAQMHGTRILLRPDLFERLVLAVRDRIVLREVTLLEG
jgi:hypothetical protein